MATNISKGNPAMVRMQNPKKKANRAASWARAQEKKRKNREENEARAARNRELRAQGLPTPHEEKKAKRRARRAAARGEEVA